MAVRATMAELISRLRTLIGDPAGASQTFDDQTLQDYLDRRQTAVRFAPLRAEGSPRPDGTVDYLDYYADVGDWEADEALYDGSYNVLTPDAADRLTGHWAFETSREPPVCIVGKFYDVYAAAADVLEAWAAREKLSFDFEMDGQGFKRSQKVAALLQVAREYRRQQRPMSVAMVRADANG
jgi:hypothetical protein